MIKHVPRGGPHVGEYVVRAPRPADAVGSTLRGAFAVAALPDDMQAALDALARVQRS